MKKYRVQIIFLVLLLWGIPFTNVFAAKCTQAQHEFQVEILEYATGEKDGLREYTCIYCGDSYTEIIPRTGHRFGEYLIKQEADCAHEGVRYRICEHCGLEEHEIIPFSDQHSFGEWVTTERSSCAENGLSQRVCTKCGYTQEQEIPATGDHHYSESTQAATCTKDGEITYTCDDCGYSYSEKIAAIGHDWGPFEMQEEPTETSEGVSVSVCKNDASHIRKETIQRLELMESETQMQMVQREITDKTGIFNELDLVFGSVNVGTFGLFFFFIRRDVYVINWDRRKKELLRKRGK